MKGENFVTSYCIMLIFKAMEMWQLLNKMLCYDSKHKVDDLDNKWETRSE